MRQNHYNLSPKDILGSGFHHQTFINLSGVTEGRHGSHSRAVSMLVKATDCPSGTPQKAKKKRISL
ncbi:mCG114991 [Mus musculus]|jgi:hypothetical protein|nr:mCG114991 [Mus musculus]